jgi:DNA-binding MarR family transcriptional regulator
VHELIAKAILAAGTPGLKKTEIKKKTKVSRPAIDTHLDALIKAGTVVKDKLVKDKHHYVWARIYHNLYRRCREDFDLTHTAEELVNQLEPIVSQLASRPVGLWNLYQKGRMPLPARFPVNTDPKAPASIDFTTDDEWQEFFEHKKRVFGGLHRCFIALAKVIIVADFGLIDAKNDLSNVTVRFHKERDVWTVLSPGKEDSDSMLCTQIDLAKKEHSEWKKRKRVIGETEAPSES